jgi:hypothetical protein
MINLFLNRLFCKPTHTVGNLSIGTNFFCNTLEDKVRDLNEDGDLTDPGEIKVYGETAIPYGRYQVVVTYSPKFNRELPLILDVKHFIGIRIHRGRSIANTSGCVLVGENTSKAILTNGEYYERKLTAMLKAYISVGELIYINVI